MANHKDITNVLIKNLTEDEKDEKDGKNKHKAIAVVGDWGIGKTFLWRKFYNDKKDSLHYKKYVYVSLFSINSLQELKIKTATDISTRDSGAIGELAPKAKNLIGMLSSASVGEQSSSLSLNISSSMVSNLILSSLEDTLVCFDDLERRGKNLPIDEVMGLVNYLTQEKNCSVVCLLNREEVNDDQYHNYKEKVFAVEINIDDSLDVIIERCTDKNQEIVKGFYSVFQVKNIRFYERVFELYDSFIEALKDKDLSETSKNTILSSLLLLVAFDKMPKLMGLTLDEFINDYSRVDWVNQYSIGFDVDDNENNNKKEVNERLYQFAGYFRIDAWQLAILKYMNSYKTSDDIANLLDNDLFDEEKLANKKELDVITTEFHSLVLQPNFSQRLADALKKNIDTENYSNISLWCNVLNEMNKDKDANKIINKTKKKIDLEIENYAGNSYLNDVYPFGKSNDNDIFFDYIRAKLDKATRPTIEQIINFFTTEYNKEGANRINHNFLTNMTKEELEYVIWVDADELNDRNRKRFIKSIINSPYLNENIKEKFRIWAVEILEERAKSAETDEKYALESFLEWTNNLKTPEP